MTISAHLETFAGLIVVDYQPGQTHRRGEPGACAYRLSAYEFEKKANGLPKLIDLYLEEPNADQTTALVIGPWNYEDMIEIEMGRGGRRGNQEIVEALAAARERLPRLRALFLGDVTFEECEISWLNQGDVAPLLAAYPDLEEFRVRGVGGLTFGKNFRHDGLRTLAIESGGLPEGNLVELWDAELPSLEHLELWLGTNRYGGIDAIEPLQSLLSGRLFPNLHYLGLRNSDIADAVAHALAASPLLERVRVLDLSMGNLTDDGVNALLACPAVRKLEKLDIHFHFVSKEGVEALRRLGIEVDADDPQEPDTYDYNGVTHVERYNAVSE